MLRKGEQILEIIQGELSVLRVEKRLKRGLKTKWRKPSVSIISMSK